MFSRATPCFDCGADAKGYYCTMNCGPAMSKIETTREATSSEIVREMDRRGTVIEKLEAEIEALRKALLPLSVLRVPAHPQGNAGAYSIRHSDIEAAKKVLGAQS